MRESLQECGAGFPRVQEQVGTGAQCNESDWILQYLRCCSKRMVVGARGVHRKVVATFTEAPTPKCPVQGRNSWDSSPCREIARCGLHMHGRAIHIKVLFICSCSDAS